MNSTVVTEALFNRTLFGVQWNHVTHYPPFFTLDRGQTAVADGFNNSRSAPDEEPYILLNQGYPLYETVGVLSSAVVDILSARVFAGGTPTPNGIIMQMTGALYNQLVHALSSAGISDSSDPPERDADPFSYAIGWDDPSERIMSALDEIIFRAAVATARTDVLRNVSWMYTNDNLNSVPAPLRNGADAERYRLMPGSQLVSMRQKQTVQVFVSNYAFPAGWVAVILVAVVGVMPQVYRF